MGRTTKKISDRRAGFIRADYRRGDSMHVIAEAHRVSWSSVKRICDDIERVIPPPPLTNSELTGFLTRWAR